MTEPTQVVLASRSPRRRELLDLLGLTHQVIPAEIDESPLPHERPHDLAGRVAAAKALAVAASAGPQPVLAADTVVDVAGTALGKPSSAADAAAMLRALSGRTHQVHTGVALARGDRCEVLVDTTSVRFRSLSEAGIRWYVATGEPMDKAGAYAVQGAGGLFVESIEGSPHTVIGLPIHLLPRLFASLGLDLWQLLT